MASAIFDTTSRLPFGKELFFRVCVRHIRSCANHCPYAVCPLICVARCCLFPCNCSKSGLFPHCFASLASAHHLQVNTRLKLQNVNFVPCLPGAMTQPFAANADNVLCIDVLLPSAVPSCVLRDVASPASMRSITSDNSDNHVAANITNTLESAEAPVLKLHQVVKTQDHAMSELSRRSSDALEMVSEHLTNFAAPSTNMDTVQSKTPTNPRKTSQDVGDHDLWPGLDLHEIIQGLVNALAPLQTLMRVHEKRMATLEEVQRTAQMPVLARRVLAVETSLASLNADIERQSSWMSNVQARLESLETSIAAISDKSNHWFATSVVTHLSDLDAVLPCLGKPGVHRDPPESESSEKTSNAWLMALPARLRIIESNLEMLGTVYRHWDVTQEPCTLCSTNTSANNTNDGCHRTFVQRGGIPIFTMFEGLHTSFQAKLYLKPAFST